MNKRGWLKWYVVLGIVILFVVIFFLATLVKNVFCGATDNAMELNDKVKEDIRLLFLNEGVRVVAPESNTAFPGQEKGIAFGIRNIFNETKRFEYEVKPIDLEGCKINESDAEKDIIFGTGGMSIPGGSIEYNRVLFSISENSKQCSLKYKVNIVNEKVTYGSAEFEIKVISKSQYEYNLISKKRGELSILSVINKVWTC